ncbi:uncharacterized protein [Littorina saxatilis]|uniref:uncharacterized protein n=1 Tax=Littorina saxatilis TaxID=31220 RepID=UPI0038B48541
MSRIMKELTCNYHKFADDTQLRGSEIPEKGSILMADKLEQCEERVKDWMLCNKLKQNDNKTKALKVVTRSQCSRAPGASLGVGDHGIAFKPYVKNLGVYLDSQFSKSRQVSHICSTSYLEIRRVAKIRRFLTKKAATQLVCACVTPHIDYYNSLLAGISTDQLSRIQRVQNSAARVILQKKRRDHVTPLLNHLHWLPVQQRIQYKLGTLAFNYFHGTLPPYLSSKLTKYSPTRSLRSSSQLLLTVPRTKLKISWTKILPISKSLHFGTHFP